jgi:hypothetical protein
MIAYNITMLQDPEDLLHRCPSCGGYLKADTYKEYLEVEEFTRQQLQIMKDIACILHMKRTVKLCWINTVLEIQTYFIEALINVMLYNYCNEHFFNKLHCLVGICCFDDCVANRWCCILAVTYYIKYLISHLSA